MKQIRIGGNLKKRMQIIVGKHQIKNTSEKNEKKENADIKNTLFLLSRNKCAFFQLKSLKSIKRTLFNLE